MFGQGQYSARLHARRQAVLGRLPDRTASSGGISRRTRAGAAAAAVALIGGLVVTSAGSIGVQAGVVGQGFSITPADLSFILEQIKIGEAHVVNTTPETGPCGALLGNGPDQIPSPLLSFGIRTVDGSCNNLQVGQEKFGAADQTFPRLAAPTFRNAEPLPFDTDGPGPEQAGDPTSYAQTNGSVADSEPRTISNLIVDQTSDNPAAVAAAAFPIRSQGNPGIEVCTDPPTIFPDGTPVPCVPEHQTLFIPNVTTDVGLSPPFNGLFTIFGQFFDHGLDKITNGGAGVVFVPLKDDDPLVLRGPDGVANTGDELDGPNAPRFMTLTRATIFPGADGFRNAQNTDSPFVDQSQTYTSHSSHQVYTREFVLEAGRPVTTGKFLSAPDGAGMANWAQIKQQTSEKLGLQLLDTDVHNIPLIVSDPYGNFIPGPLRGMPMVMIGGTAVEGDPAANGGLGISLVGADRIGTAFLNDIAHAAGPGSTANPKTPDADDVAGSSLDPVAPGEYDDELLNLHFICGDGRCNENIALTAVHQIFHSEHDRLIDDIENTLSQPENAALLAAFQATNCEFNCLTNDPGLRRTFKYGERLFQSARFVTEMEYQHLVFEEFARKVQPAINPFEPFAFNQTDVNPAITAEFAHAVYRFGHSMLTETIDRIAPDGTHFDIPLLTGFLNPARYYDNQAVNDSKAAATAIFMGMSDQVGNEIDEFVTSTLRNNLLGLPLDLPSINMTRARSEGIPSLNNLRKQIFARTNDGQLAPYENWMAWGQALKHPESLTNFIAAYGTHPSIMTLDPDGPGGILPGGLVSRRMAADQIVTGTELPGPDGFLTDDPGTLEDESADNIPAPADSGDFLFSDGAWANTGGNSITGVDGIDLWVGGLAESTLVFGGLLGATFNYVFENQLTNLQNGDRFYYLGRTPGMNLRTQLEGNSFAELVMRNTDAYSLKADPFATADCKFHLIDITGPAPAGSFITGPGSVTEVPSSDCEENRLLLRQPNGRVEYRAVNSVDPSGINGQGVYDGTVNVDRIFGGNDNDTFWGREGADIIDGRGGDDNVLGGEGNDIITDLGGFDVLKGGPGNDAIDGGVFDDLLMGGDGVDFTNGGANNDEHFLGQGDDFAIGGQGFSAIFGDSGDDWEEGGDMADLLIGDSSTLFFDDHNIPGHDVTIGQGGDDDYDTEGGDDIMVAGPGVEKNAGASGYDWSIGLNDPQKQFADLNLPILPEGQPVVEVRDRFNEVEALSGWDLDDELHGDDVAPAAQGGGGFIGCDVLNQAGLDRIAGLDALVPPLNTLADTVLANTTSRYCLITPGELVWGDGNIILGGAGSDIMEGRGADDILDGDKYMDLRLSIHTNPDGTGAEIASSTLMESIPTGSGWTGALAGKTLQQAVFAGLIDPGQITMVREILTPATVPDADCGSITPLNCDTALFSADPAGYTITDNGDGSVTISDAAGAAVDGTDTIWNTEQASFCTAVDADGRCIASVIVPLTGGGAAPVAEVATTPPTPPAALALDFGDVSSPSAGVTQAFTVNNTGTAPLLITSAAVTGTDALSFTATPQAACASVAPSGSCTVDVVFAPTSIGAKTATVTVFHNSNNLPGSTSVVTVTGTGTAPVANITPASLAFGTQAVGTTSVAQIISVQNTGNGTLNISAPTIGGVNGNQFNLTNGCGVTVAPGASCNISVTFAPTTAGAKTGSVSITHNSNNVPGTTTTVTLGGNGGGAVLPVLTMPANVAFGAQRVNQNRTISVTVQNQGPGALLITAVNTSGGAFTATRGTCPVSLAAGRSCKLSVTFRPTIIGQNYTGTLTVISNAANNPTSATLTGTGRR